MRIWDLDPSLLCDRHLLGEHRELHAIWCVIVNNKRGYARHPETMRWRGKLAALYERHEALVRELSARGFKHNSPLDRALATGSRYQDVYVNTVEEQIMILRRKGCGCRV
ncbi:MAG: pyrimidine dimer DNA glycosylase/endonuclease V [Thermoprotei archaeon]